MHVYHPDKIYNFPDKIFDSLELCNLQSTGLSDVVSGIYVHKRISFIRFAYRALNLNITYHNKLFFKINWFHPVELIEKERKRVYH